MAIPEFTDLTLGNISSLLNTRYNLQLIEEILREKARKLGELQNSEKAGILDFGNPLDGNSLVAWYKQVSTDVSSFLGCGKRYKPILAMSIYKDVLPANSLANSHLEGNGYNPFYELISLTQEKETLLIPIIAHEETHSKLSQLELSHVNNIEAEEGLCRAVQRHISTVYASRYDNPCFAYRSLDLDVGELRSYYRYMLGMRGRLPEPSLLLPASCTDKVELGFYLAWKTPTPHSIGNTFFQLQETLFGEEIYKDMLSAIPVKEPDILLMKYKHKTYRGMYSNKTHSFRPQSP